MKKRIMCIGLMMVMVLSVVGFVGCRSYRTDYFRVRLNRNEGYAIVYSLTELGKEQEILIVPRYVRGLPVRQVGRMASSFMARVWLGIDSDRLQKLYLPYTAELFREGAIQADCVEVVILGERVIAIFKHWVQQELLQPNIIYHYNFINAPNQGYYWIDNITGDNLYIAPQNPTRSGYTFNGWFMESESITPWDGLMPTSQEQKVVLYAGWIAV